MPPQVNASPSLFRRLWGGGSAPATTVFLRHQIEAEDRGRELVLLKLVAAAAALCAVGAVAAGLTALRDNPPWLAAASFAGWSVYSTGLAWFFSSRQMPRWLPWVNTLAENTAVAFTIWLSASQGAVVAVTHEGNFFWVMVILMSSLRRRPGLSLFSGAVGAAELLVLFFGSLRAPLSLTPYPTFHVLFTLRAVALLFAGVEAAAIAAVINRKVEETIGQLRERDLFAKYFLGERIGAGGMAEVFKATYAPEGGFQREVAVKKILPAYAADPKFVALFLRESELGSLLNHRNIVQTLDVGRHGDNYFIAMEYVDGISLDRLVRFAGVALPVPVVSLIGAELADALDYLHHRKDAVGSPLGLVHRDVTPSNVLVSRGGEVKLADFGILRAMSQPGMTTQGSVRGKAGYMSPEQMADGPLDARSDLFALGCTLYEALTGFAPFARDSSAATAYAALGGRYEPLGTLRSDVPQGMVDLIDTMLQADVNLRPATGRAVRDQLLALPDGAAPDPQVPARLGALVAEAHRRRAAAVSESNASREPTATTTSGVETLRSRKSDQTR